MAKCFWIQWTTCKILPLLNPNTQNLFAQWLIFEITARLDYSKIARSHNKLSALTGQQKRLSDGADRASRVTTFDLSRLVENVVEGTFAGHNYRSSASLSSKTSAERGSQNDLYRGTRNTPPNMNPNVSGQGWA